MANEIARDDPDSHAEGCAAPRPAGQAGGDPLAGVLRTSRMTSFDVRQDLRQIELAPSFRPARGQPADPPRYPAAWRRAWRPEPTVKEMPSEPEEPRRTMKPASRHVAGVAGDNQIDRRVRSAIAAGLDVLKRRRVRARAIHRHGASAIGASPILRLGQRETPATFHCRHLRAPPAGTERRGDVRFGRRSPWRTVKPRVSRCSRACEYTARLSTVVVIRW